MAWIIFLAFLWLWISEKAIKRSSLLIRDICLISKYSMCLVSQKLSICRLNQVNLMKKVFQFHNKFLLRNVRFFHKQRFFPTQSHCCLTFSWIDLQMFLSCCLIYMTIIILRHILCPCLGLGLFMPICVI